MLISEAFAQAAGAAPAGGLDNLGQFLPLVLIFVVFYFLLLRPQQQKAKRHKELVSALRRGDRVLSQSGMFGTVNKVVNDTEVLVEIADNVRVRMLKSSVAEVLSKTEPVAAKTIEGEATTVKDGTEAPAEPQTMQTKMASALGRLLGKK